jgi:hypothetical protein
MKNMKTQIVGTMKNIISALILLSFFGNNSFAQSVNDPSAIKIGKELTMTSKVLDKEQKVLIHLPKKFNSEKEYPLVMLLDFMAFNSLASITEIMGYNKTIEKCIVVCPVFTNVREEYSPTNNTESDSDCGMKTIKYFEKELLPFITSKYKISKKILWGQGYSGMFSTFVMLESPHLFDAYFSDLPKLNFIEPLLSSQDIFNNISNTELSYFISSTSFIKENIELENFLKKLKENAPPNLNWSYMEQDDTIPIAHISSNYIYALQAFLNNTNHKN